MAAATLSFDTRLLPRRRGTPFPGIAARRLASMRLARRRAAAMCRFAIQSTAAAALTWLALALPGVL